MTFLDFGSDLVQKAWEAVKDFAKTRRLYAVEVKPPIRRKMGRMEIHERGAIFMDADGNYYLVRIESRTLRMDSPTPRQAHNRG